MARERVFREQSVKEEGLNSLTHGVGALLSFFALLLLVKQTEGLSATARFSAAFYGVSLLMLFSASSLLHASYALSRGSDFLCRLDHASVFLLILGTYAPVMLSLLGGILGGALFALALAVALFGILRIFLERRVGAPPLPLYLTLGWAAFAAGYPLYLSAGFSGLSLLLLGGLFYSVGVLFYRRKDVAFSHVLWHLFVLGGSLFHFFFVYLYCL